MKNTLFIFFILLTNFFLRSQISENFQSWTSRNTYGTWTQITIPGTFSMVQSIVAPTGAANGSGSVGFVQLGSATTNGGTNQGKLTFPSVNTCGTLSLTIRSSGASGDFFLEKSTNNGVSWTLVQSFTNAPLTGTLYNISVNDASSSVILRINGDNIGNSTNRRTMYIHDINVTPNNNTNCSTVTSLSVPTTTLGTTTTGLQSTCGKTNDYPVNSFGSSLYGDGEDAVWSITIPSGGGNYQFDLGGSSTYKILSLHSSCTPSNSNVINWSTTSSGTSTFFTNQLSSGTYYLWVDTWPSPTCGEYSITITKLPDPPVNDNPSGAIPLTINSGTYSTYTNQYSTATSVTSPSCGNYVGEDVWFSVVVPSNGIIELDMEEGGVTDAAMSVYTGTIGSLTELGCNDDSLTNLMPYLYLTGLPVGQTLYIRVWEYGGGTTGTFDIIVNSPVPLPVELIYFEGYVYPSFNSLKWSTASEYNSDYFRIERSVDGVLWKVVGIKSASGNSNIKINYSYLDSFDDLVIHYYRLVQVDYDGNYKIYGPISLDNTKTFKKVIKYVNILGQEVNPESKGVMFELYEDGTSKKIIR